MAPFMKEDLSDELASLPVKLSAAELRPGRGQTQIHGGNNPSERAGEERHKQPTHSPLLGFNSRQIFVMQPPALILQGRTVLQAPPPRSLLIKAVKAAEWAWCCCLTAHGTL